MNVNAFLQKDYDNVTAFRLEQNKPNSNPISLNAKMNASFFATKDYENKTTFRLEQNKPKQSQGIKRVRSEWRFLKGIMRRKLPYRQEAAYELEDTALVAKREQELPLEVISSIGA